MPHPQMRAVPTYVALLRAVNLPNNNKINMTALRELCEAQGFQNVRTVVQTGNVVFESKALPARLEASLEGALKSELGLDTDVLVRSSKDWRALVDANPFRDAAREDPSHLLAMPLKGAPSKAQMETLVTSIPGREQAKVQGSVLYLVYPDGIGRSKLTSAFIERRVGFAGTARNWNTVQKVLAVTEA